MSFKSARIFGSGTKPISTAFIVGQRAVVVCEHSLLVLKTLSKDGVDQSYETDYWVQEKTNRNGNGDYSSNGRVKVKLHKCHSTNDWALLYRTTGLFNEDEIAHIDTTAAAMDEDQYFTHIQHQVGALLYCPVRLLQNTKYANQFTLAAFIADVTIQTASRRHISYAGRQTGGGVFVNGNLLAMNQEGTSDYFDEDDKTVPLEFCDTYGIPLPVRKRDPRDLGLSLPRTSGEGDEFDCEEPLVKRVKVDRETVVGRGVNTPALKSAIILCLCDDFMANLKVIEDDSGRSIGFV